MSRVPCSDEFFTKRQKNQIKKNKERKKDFIPFISSV